MTHPDLKFLPPFYKGYVDHVKDMHVLDAMRNSGKETFELVITIPETKGEYRYQEGKWSIKEVLCHMMDAERIFAYRALRFARNDKTALHGFEENDYAPQANAHSRSIRQIAEEMQRLRATSLDLYQSFTPQMLERTGIANKAEFAVINLGYIIAGHECHHRKVLKERYL